VALNPNKPRHVHYLFERLRRRYRHLGAKGNIPHGKRALRLRVGRRSLGRRDADSHLRNIAWLLLRRDHAAAS